MGERECLGCGQAIQVDPRFSAWCPHCLWNVDPVPGPPEPQGRTARRRDHERQLATQVHDRVVRDGARVPSGPLRAAVLAAAVVTHLVSLLLVGLLLWLLIADLAFIVQLVLVPPVAVLVVSVWPRPGRLDRDVRTLTARDAPATFEVVRQVAAALAVPVPEVVAVDTEYRAALVRVGWGRRPVLVLGWPLWNVLDGPGQVALVAHELGHLVDGDVRTMLPVSLASDTLDRWARAFRMSPGNWERAMYKVRFSEGTGDYAYVVRGGTHEAASLSALLEVVVGWVLRPVAFVLGALQRAFESAAARAGEASGYVADDAAARVAGTAATVRVLRTACLSGPAERAVTSAVNRNLPDIWAAEREAITQLPSSEVDRALIACGQRWDRADASQPPTHLRVDVLVTRPEQAAAVVPPAATMAAMDRELGAQVRRDRVAVSLSRTSSGV
jgi:Zn-dependent protease with chaperone function